MAQLSKFAVLLSAFVMSTSARASDLTLYFEGTVDSTHQEMFGRAKIDTSWDYLPGNDDFAYYLVEDGRVQLGNDLTFRSTASYAWRYGPRNLVHVGTSGSDGSDSFVVNFSIESTEDPWSGELNEPLTSANARGDFFSLGLYGDLGGSFRGAIPNGTVDVSRGNEFSGFRISFYDNGTPVSLSGELTYLSTLPRVAPAVPESGTLAMWLLGLAAVVAKVRRAN